MEITSSSEAKSGESNPTIQVEVEHPSYPDHPEVGLEEQRRAFVLSQICNGDPAAIDANVLAKACDILNSWLRDGQVPSVAAKRPNLKPVP
jgi:hypothetical protein